jgi:hypothetical protein
MTYLLKNYPLRQASGSLTAAPNTIVKVTAADVIVTLPSAVGKANDSIVVIGKGTRTKVSNIAGTADTYLSDGETAEFYMDYATGQWLIGDRDCMRYILLYTLTYTAVNSACYGLLTSLHNSTVDFIGYKALADWSQLLTMVLRTISEGLNSVLFGSCPVSTLYTNSTRYAPASQIYAKRVTGLTDINWASSDSAYLISSFADAGSGRTRIVHSTWTAYSVNTKFSIANTVNYNGTYVVAASTTTSIDFVKAYVAETPTSLAMFVVGAAAAYTTGSTEIALHVTRLSKV